MKNQYILTLSLFLFIITSISCKKPKDPAPDDNVPSVNAGRLLKHVFTDEYYIKNRTFYYKPNGLVDSSVFLYDDNRKFTSKFFYNNNNRIDYYSGPVFGLLDINWSTGKNAYIYDADSNLIKVDFNSKSSKDDHLEDFTLTFNSDNRISSFKERWNFTFYKTNYIWDGDNISEMEVIQDLRFNSYCNNANDFIVPVYKCYYTFDLSLNNDLKKTYDDKIFKPKYLNKNLIVSEVRCVYSYDRNMDSCTIVLNRIDTFQVNYSYEYENGRVTVIKQNGVVTDSISYYK